MTSLHARAARHLANLIPPGPEGMVWWLTVMAAIGVTSIIPLLPLYAQAQGADLHVIGMMAASYLVTNLAFLYGAGRLSDVFGRRPLMFIGLIAYAGCSLGFIFWPTAVGFIVLRAIEGVAAACFLPAALAYVADRYPLEQRGLRISQLAMAENLGLLLGPAFGGLVKTQFGMPALFVILTAMCGVGAAMVFRLPVVKATPHLEAPPPSHWGDVRRALLAGVSVRAWAGGFAFGLYLTAWPIFMKKLEASDWDVALSWTLFAVPALIFGPWSGRLIDRHGPGTSAVLGAAFSACVVAGYAWSWHVYVLLGLCMLEGIGFAFAYPAQNTLTVQTSPEDMRGRVIGLVTAVKTLGTLVGALATPVLYGISPYVCFGVVSLVQMTGAVALAISLVIDHRRRPPTAPAPAAGLSEAPATAQEGAPLA